MQKAGVRGTVDQALVARCDRPLIKVGEGAAVGQMQIFSIEADVVAATWPKMFQRQRRWVSLQEVAESVKGAHFRAALRRFASIMAPIA